MRNPQKYSAKFLTLYNTTTFSNCKEDLRTFIVVKVLNSALFAFSLHLSGFFAVLNSRTYIVSCRVHTRISREFGHALGGKSVERSPARVILSGANISLRSSEMKRSRTAQQHREKRLDRFSKGGIYGRLHSARVILSLSNPGRSEGRTAEPFGSHGHGFPLVDPQNAYRVLTFKNPQFVADF